LEVIREAYESISDAGRFLRKEVVSGLTASIDNGALTGRRDRYDV
jgi:hypothetical protein